MQVLRGDAARTEIGQRLNVFESQIAVMLAPYDPITAVQSWHANVRAAEEFINAPLFGIDDDRLAKHLLAFPLAMLIERSDGLTLLKAMLRSSLDDDVAERISLMALKLATFGSTLRAFGIPTLGDGVDLRTYAGALAYLQSRRRHFVSLLYLMPKVCQGATQLGELDGIAVVGPIVELNAIFVTGLHQQRVLLEIYPDFTLTVDGPMARASHDFDTLEDLFLEPERASIATMSELRREQITPVVVEPLHSRKLFSAAELRNEARWIEAAYTAFGLQDSDFAIVARLVIAFSRHATGDYYIHMPHARLMAMLASQSQIAVDSLERLLVSRPGDYAACTNAFQPFIAVGDHVTSNVRLLSRFLYNFKNVHLASRKRFVIHAGFIFEDMVKRDLAAMGFHVETFKRLNRQEFDVVATRNGTAFNIQCKNNVIDLSQVEANPRLFARYNRRLCGYYRRALAKEQRREYLLVERLGMAQIRHLVVSRFPIITDHPDIVAYNRLAAAFA